jgi:hypothetical protein
MLAGVDLRRRWRHVVVRTLLVGVAGAVVSSLAAAAALLVVNLVAAFPAGNAAHTRPAVVLRSE